LNSEKIDKEFTISEVRAKQLAFLQEVKWKVFWKR